MNKELYPLIFKRKSYHLFRNNRTLKSYSSEYHISPAEYGQIEAYFSRLEPLDEDIRIALRIADNEETTCERGQEKVILLYSEAKDNWLMNMGYIGEQLDLFLTSLNIGTLWFGLNKAEMPDYDGLKYVIMIAISKVPEDSFRKDMFKAKRQEVKEIWSGDDPGIANIVRFAPSACNTQPWRVVNEDGTLKVYRYHGEQKKLFLSETGARYFNRIDIGIFLCFLELCLQEKDINYQRELFIDDRDDLTLNKVAEYRLA